MPNSLAELIKCRWREFLREPSAFFFVLATPILTMLALGYAFTQPEDQVTRIPVSVLTSTDQSAALPTPPIDLVAVLQTSKELEVTPVSDLDAWRRQVQQGRSSLLVAWQKDSLQYRLDPQAPNAKLGYYIADNALQKALGRTQPSPTAVIRESRTGQRYIDFLVPGLLAFSIMTSSLFGTGMTLVINRRNQLFKRFKATPMPFSHFIWSHVVGRSLILTCEATAILLSAYLFFDFKVNGPLLAFLAIALVGTGCFTALAFLLSSRTEDAGFYNGIVNLIALPLAFTSGIWFSRQQLPEWLAHLAQYSPLALLADSLRGMAYDSASLSELWLPVALLAGLGLGFAWVARLRFRY